MANIKNYNKSQNGKSKDEWYTPKIIVEAIIKYLPKDKIIWCPFDTKNSEFVLNLQEKGFKVEYSHIFNGKDFFEYEPKKWDIIVSNPPFSTKQAILKRCIDFNKPFALLFPINILDYHTTQDFLQENFRDIQFLFLNKKVSFDGNTSSFNSSFFCRSLLPKTICFAKLENNNANQYFVKSRMWRDITKEEENA